MRRLILLCLFVSPFVFAQNDALKTQRENLLLEKQKNEEWEKNIKIALEKNEAGLKVSSEQLVQLEKMVKDRPAYVAKAIQEANDALENLSSADRLVSRKAGFYRCVRSDLKERKIVSIKNCRLSHPANFSVEDEKLIQSWTDTVTMNSSDIKFKREQLERDIKTYGYGLENAKTQLLNNKGTWARLEETEKLLIAREKDLEVIKANGKFVNCDANTPEISLEEKVPFAGAKFQGPFYGVPRDNQDGMGTCYANAAKNLVVGATQGKGVGSFLDMALLYKGDGVITGGLDAGHSCGVITKVNEVGYCPQAFAPFETGEKNIYAEGLMGGSKGTTYDQSVVVKLLQNFLAGQDTFVKNNKELSDQVLKQAKIVIHNIKARPNVKLPMPVVRREIPTAWKLKEFANLAKTKAKFPDTNKFYADYKKQYRSFYPQYVRGVVEGKSRDQIFEAFKLKMKPFIDQYELEDQLAQWKTIFLQDTESDWNDANFRKDVAKSVEFMKAMSGQPGATDQDFLKFCDETAGDTLHFMESLQPLVKHLKDVGANTDLLFDESGKFKSPTDLMQLAVAPACLKPENRIKLEPGILCESGYPTITNIRNSPAAQQKKMLRERVVGSLVQGYPLGNTFENHINTIVGMKYDPATKECQFKIRESQTGTSSWQSEQRIFSKIEALTEVRRK